MGVAVHYPSAPPSLAYGFVLLVGVEENVRVRFIPFDGMYEGRALNGDIDGMICRATFINDFP